MMGRLMGSEEANGAALKLHQVMASKADRGISSPGDKVQLALFNTSYAVWRELGSFDFRGHYLPDTRDLDVLAVYLGETYRMMRKYFAPKDG